MAHPMSTSREEQTRLFAPPLCKKSKLKKEIYQIIKSKSISLEDY
jgi:hypothetical protein